MKISHLINTSTKKVIQLSLPMAFTQLIMMGSGFLCMAMLAKLGQTVLAASALIFSINLTVTLVAASILFSLSILIGHSFGERNYLHIGSLFQQGWLLSLILSLPILITYWNIYPILISFGQDKNIALNLHHFYRAYIIGVIPILFAICNQQLCYGVHKQKIDMWGNMLGVIVLLISAYLFIFGHFGFPQLGLVGFAYAGALQVIAYFLFTTICLYYIPDFKKFDLFHFRIHKNWDTLKRLFAIGWPISLQMSSEVISFLVSTIFVGWLGINALGAYQVITQYQFLIVIPVFALSQASGILIGQAFGEKKLTEIHLLGKASLTIAAILSILTGLSFICFPQLFASLYINIHDSVNQQTLHLIVILFFILAFSQFFDALRNILTGSLRGLLDTRFPMFISVASMWLIGVPLGYVLAFPLHLHTPGILLGWMVGMLIGVIILYYRWHALCARFRAC